MSVVAVMTAMTGIEKNLKTCEVSLLAAQRGRTQKQ